MPPGFKSGCYFSPLNQPNLMVPYIGTRQAPMAYSPETGYFYIAASVNPFWATRFGISVEPGQRSERAGRLPSTPAPTRSPGSSERHIRSGLAGACWRQRVAWYFTATRTATCEALDARTGEPRWQFQIGVGAVSAPFITYELDREQYIALAPSGGASPQGGSGGAQSPGDTVWAFKLGGRSNRCRRRRPRRSCRHSRVAASLPGRTRLSSISRNGTRTPSDRLDFESMSTRLSSRAVSACPQAPGSRGRTRGTSRIRSAFEVRDGRPVPSSPMQPARSSSMCLARTCSVAIITPGNRERLPSGDRLPLPAAGRCHGTHPCRVGRDRGNLHQHGGRRRVRATGTGRRLCRSDGHS